MKRWNISNEPHKSICEYSFMYDDNYLEFLELKIGGHSRDTCNIWMNILAQTGCSSRKRNKGNPNIGIYDRMATNSNSCCRF